MSEVREIIRQNQKYLQLLAHRHPTIQSVCTEIINLRAILNLPKGTEHFMSDLHGEHEAFAHILNNCSGVIREKVKELYGGVLTEQQCKELCTLIYYPREKLAQIRKGRNNLDAWYETTLLQLIEVSKAAASKYTRSKVRKALPPDFAYIIDELLHADYGEENQSLYYKKIMESILALHNADGFIEALATLIKRLSVDRLHIVGDIFDRGPRPDIIMNMLTQHHSVDIQWGNHDILWMGAAAGSEACIAAVVNNCAAFGNLKVLEQGYGVNLRPLAMFAEKTYPYSSRFAPRAGGGDEDVDKELAAKIHKAIAIILFKLEGQLIRRRPEYGMDNRLLLDKIQPDGKTVRIGERNYPLADSVLPTLHSGDPYRLTAEEQGLMEELKESFRHSERLNRHIRFLYANGGMYKICNQNLLYHGCIPMEADGSFAAVDINGTPMAGRALMDWADTMARQVFFDRSLRGTHAADAMWYLWCGRKSPLFGRHGMTTFERLFVLEESTWAEEQNPYYRHIQDPACCCRILAEFGLPADISHIVNGHVPVRASRGESPVKADGKLIVIDGGFCKTYQPRTGIAGYTLIYNSYGLRLSAHRPFQSIRAAVENNMDIHSTTTVFEVLENRMKVMDTDVGTGISDQIFDLSLLLEAYRAGTIKPGATH